jgi:hypothetical protein
VRDHVVGAHRDGRVRWSRTGAWRRDGGLGADAVGRADEHGLSHAGGQRDGTGETAQAAEQLDRAEGPVDVGPQKLDGAVAGADVDTSRRVGAALRGHRAPATGSSSSTNLWEATS